MPAKQHLQPAELFESQQWGFTQVVTSPPGKLVFVSGQVAWDREGKLVGGSDLVAQAEQVLVNLGHALRAAGSSPSDITMVRAYIVNYRPEFAGQLSPIFSRFIGSNPPPAQTWVGVQSLAAPDFLIEVEAVAVVAA